MLSTVKNCIVNLYYFLFDRFILYPLMAILPKKFNIRFMNLGYAARPFGTRKPHRVNSTCENNKITDILNSTIEPNDAIRAHVHLYEKALSLCPKYPFLEGFMLAEVGCGLGGGVEWIKRAHPEIKQMTGIDKVVADSRGNTLIQGTADNLPLPSSSIDLVINIESSHLYKSTLDFLKEVHRVLRPKGYFCWADIRFKDELPVILEQAIEAGFELIEYENITSGVLHGIEYTSRQYDGLFDKAPWIFKLFKGSIRTTYCAPGTYTYNRLAKRDKIYAAACWTKKCNP